MDWLPAPCAREEMAARSSGRSLTERERETALAAAWMDFAVREAVGAAIVCAGPCALSQAALEWLCSTLFPENRHQTELEIEFEAANAAAIREAGR